MSSGVVSLSGTSLLKHAEVWEGYSKFCSLAKISAGREIFFFPWTIPQRSLSAYFKENVTQVTTNQIDSPTSTISTIRKKCKWLDIMRKLVVLISIIITLWQEGRHFSSSKSPPRSTWGLTSGVRRHPTLATHDHTTLGLPKKSWPHNGPLEISSETTTAHLN